MRFEKLALQRIEAAMEEGLFDNLPGAGRPLPTMPEGDFMEHFGARLMKEAGAVPQEVSLKQEIIKETKLTADMPEGEERDKALLALNKKRLCLSMMMEKR